MQQVSRSDQGWRRRLPSGTSAAMSARERLEARRRIERLLDEDRRRVAPPPEKATTPVGWLDHERCRCSLEGAATTSSFGSVDDERRRTAGRRKPDNESGKNLRNHSSRGPAGTISSARSSCPPSHPLTSSRRSKQRETGEKGGGRKHIGDGVRPSSAPLRRA